MKSLQVIVFALFNLTTLSAFAHADQPSVPAAEQQVAATSAAQASSAPRLKLPLDHGPRATSTPWLNERTRQRIARQQQQHQAAQGAEEPTTTTR